MASAAAGVARARTVYDTYCLVGFKSARRGMLIGCTAIQR